jgi:all-trans-8'-apo-beta-carotenal 15,15'-oxygenase
MWQGNLLPSLWSKPPPPLLILLTVLWLPCSHGLSTQLTSSATKTWTTTAWKTVLSDLPFETKLPKPLRVTGSIPSTLRGILYKAGPAKFQRNGHSYQHWLEGDGAVVRLEFGADADPPVRFSSRWVQTESFRADEQANAITTRGTFGTPKTNGRFQVLDLKLKHPANTNAIRIGNQVWALSEVGLPYRLDPITLETKGLETMNGRYVPGNSAATVGIPFLDRFLGFGNAMVAHVRRVPLGESSAKPSLVMAGVQQHAFTEDTRVDLWELDPTTGQVWNLQTDIVLQDTGFPPHDFICTRKHAIWLTCPAGGNLVPFLLGQKGPAECLSFRPGATSTLHVVTRQSTLVRRFALPGPVHPVHFGCAWDIPKGVIVYLSGWDTTSLQEMMERREPLLGSWSTIQQGDFSNIQPQRLLKVSLRNGQVTVERVAQNSIDHIDFVKCHPHWEGRECRFLYGTISTPPTPGSPAGMDPPQTICIVDLKEETIVDSWFAGRNNILDDCVLVPKSEDESADERDAWVIAPCFQGATNTTTFVVLDASNLSAGPVCEAHLDDHHIPWALHGTWWSN